ncbi:HAMP domain-containing sensor histidine kinase [Hymenobacter psychrophilus]|uniref:histidine kinase n=1 Tax=Hymenobacter psychrophilus TaxID=651662 RepID=A0A1H3LDA3_9BACT|nr:ATP-binding protein [Hymenobacter psychrophilus]SDY61855.1 PAS domain S-box-containing protein [Hymenobacter psychrophilus]
MTFKTKITLGFLALLTLLLALGGYAFYTVRQLDQSARGILKDNFYSVQLGQQMLRALDGLDVRPEDAAALAQFRESLTREAGNITEPGEKEIVDSLTAHLATYERLTDAAGADGRGAVGQQLRGQTHRMVQLNINTLEANNDRATATATRAGYYLLLVIGLSVLTALTFVVRVPAAAVAPLRRLAVSIEHATNQDFSATIPVESTDEFGQVALAFNQLLVQLNEYRNSTMAQLVTERNRAASIVNGLNEGLLLLDQHRTILLANPVACELLGLEASQLLGRPAAEVALENDLVRTLLQPLETAGGSRNGSGSGSEVAEAPLLHITQRGEEAYFRLDVQDLLSFNEALNQKEFAGQILTLRNVSDFKRLDQVKSNFLATVSHELKTPLSSMNINLRLLQDERLPADERQRVTASIRQETQRLQRMVGELLDVSRLDAGAGIQLDVKPTNLADVVRYATTTVQAQLTDKQLHLDLQLPPDLPAARADVEKTTWVLINLLANAIRYSPPGETLTVAAEAMGQKVRVSVQDRGPGIAAEHHERIFQRFAQLPDPSGYRGGSGLGLSIAREFIATQGGRLWVESELGAGSMFCFTLPVI